MNFGKRKGGKSKHTRFDDDGNPLVASQSQVLKKVKDFFSQDSVRNTADDSTPGDSCKETLESNIDEINACDNEMMNESQGIDPSVTGEKTDEILTANDRKDSTAFLSENNVSDKFVDTFQSNDEQKASVSEKEHNVPVDLMDESPQSEAFVSEKETESHGRELPCYDDIDMFDITDTFEVNQDKQAQNKDKSMKKKDNKKKHSAENELEKDEQKDADSLSDSSDVIKEVSDDSIDQDSQRQSNKSAITSTKKKRWNRSEKRKMKRKRKLSIPSDLLGDEVMRKYWAQRYRLFSKFDEGIKLDRG